MDSEAEEGGGVKRILGRLKCFLLRKHQRGKRIAQTQEAKTYRCPRCAATWTRKVRAA